MQIFPEVIRAGHPVIGLGGLRGAEFLRQLVVADAEIDLEELIGRGVAVFGMQLVVVLIGRDVGERDRA